MNRKTLLAAALAGGTLMGLSTVAQAVPAVVASTPHYSQQQQYPVYTQPQYVYTQPRVIYTQPAPPAPIYEAVPAPRAGWVWAPGFHDWRDGRYVWTTGRWVQERPGWVWQEARWQQRADGSWYMVGGQWVQGQQYGSNDRRGGRLERGPNGDIDGDGIRNEDDRDRDGDGVSNRDDDFPNNPNRS